MPKKARSLLSHLSDHNHSLSQPRAFPSQGKPPPPWGQLVWSSASMWSSSHSVSSHIKPGRRTEAMEDCLLQDLPHPRRRQRAPAALLRSLIQHHHSPAPSAAAPC